MAEQSSAPPQKGALPAAEPVGIGSRLRQGFEWFDSLSQQAKEAAVEERRRTERLLGTRLSPEKLVELADELDEIQRMINPLDRRRKEIAAALVRHWAHTGVFEIEGTTGRTLITTSFELCVAPNTIRREVGETLWRRMTKRVLQPKPLLALATHLSEVRDALGEAIAVKALKVSVTPPSSRRPKSGETDSGEEEEE